MQIHTFSQFDPFKSLRLVWDNKPPETTAAEKAEAAPAAPAEDPAKAEAAAQAQADRVERVADAAKKGKTPAEEVEAFLKNALTANARKERIAALREKYKDDDVRDKASNLYDALAPIYTEFATLCTDLLKDGRITIDRITVISQNITPKFGQLIAEFKAKTTPEDNEIFELIYLEALDAALDSNKSEAEIFLGLKEKGCTADNIEEKIESGEITRDEYFYAFYYVALDAIDQLDQVIPRYKPDEIGTAYKENKDAVDKFIKGDIETIEDLKKIIITDEKNEKQKHSMEIIEWSLTADATHGEKVALIKKLKDNTPPIAPARTHEEVFAIWKNPNADLNPREFRILGELVKDVQKQAEAAASAPEGTGPGEAQETNWVDSLVIALQKLMAAFEKIGAQLAGAMKRIDEKTPEAQKFPKSPFDGDKKFTMTPKGLGAELTPEDTGSTVTAVAEGTLKSDTTGPYILTNKGAKIYYIGLELKSGLIDQPIQEGQELGSLPAGKLNLRIYNNANKEAQVANLLDPKYVKTTEPQPKEPEAKAPFLIATSPLKLDGGKTLRIKTPYSPDNNSVEIAFEKGAVVQSMAHGGIVTKAEDGIVTIKYEDRTEVTYSGLKKPPEVTKDATLAEGQQIGRTDKKSLTLSIKAPDGKPFNPTAMLENYVAAAPNPTAAPAAPRATAATANETTPRVQPFPQIMDADALSSRLPTEAELSKVIHAITGNSSALTAEEMTAARQGYYLDTSEGATIPKPIPREKIQEILPNASV